MDENLLSVILMIVFVLLFLGVGFLAGTLAERNHYRSIRRREEELRHLMAIRIKTVPPEMLPCRTQMVAGSVVVGMDYFKKFLAMLSTFVGGRVHSYETLVDRGRREAVLRMKESARALGATYVLNIKFNTANIMSGSRENRGAGCVEVIVYGTAVIPE